jgi:hypothetical protein
MHSSLDLRANMSKLPRGIFQWSRGIFQWSQGSLRRGEPPHKTTIILSAHD